MELFSFRPYYGQTQSIAATGVLTGLAADTGDLLLTRDGTGMMFVRITEAADVSVATAADCPVAPGTVMVIGKSDNVARNMTRMSVFVPAAGGTLYVTPGNGS